MRTPNLFAVAALVWAASVGAQGQSDDALKDRVGQLVSRLEGEDPKAAEGAIEALVKLGPKALPLLPEPGKLKGDAANKALEKAREALREASESVNTGASLVTIKGDGVRLSEVIRELQKQSGNPITDLRDEPANPSLDLDLEKKPFLEALDAVAAKAGLSASFYTGDGTIGLMGAGMEEGQMPAAKPNTLIRYAGPFRVEMTGISRARNFRAGSHAATVGFEVAWEPRLRPMLMKLEAKGVEVTDDLGGKVEANVAEESQESPLRPENPVIDVNLDLKAPAIEAKALKSLKVKGEVTVPAGLRTFRFPKLTETNAKQAQGEVTITLLGSEVEESVWKIELLIGYEGGGSAFESYQQGLFNNQLWLQSKDGARFEHNGGFSQTRSGAGRVGYEYLFVEVPGKLEDYQLVYQTPSKLQVIPIEFEFNDVPLP